MSETKKTFKIIGKIVDYFVLPVFIFFICYDPEFYSGFLITNDEGIHLALVNSILHGKVIYRDIFFMYGPLLVYLPALLMKIFTPSLIFFRGFVHIGSIFTLIMAYFLSRAVIKTRFFVFLLTWLLLTTKVHAFWSSRWGGMRAGVGFLALIVIIVYLKRKKRHWLGFGGVLTGICFLFSQDIGICVFLSSLACLAVSNFFHSSLGIRDYFKEALIYVIGFIISTLPFFIYALSVGALLPYLKTCFIDVPFKFPKFFVTRYPFLPFPKTLAMAAWHSYFVSRTFYFYGSIFIYCLGAIYLVVKVIKKKLTTSDLCMLLVFSFGVVLLKLATRQLYGGQFNMAAPPILITLIFLMEKIFIRAKTIFKQITQLRMVGTHFDKNQIGRNDLCPCGSGKKFKNCCLNKRGIKNILGLEMLLIILAFATFFYFFNLTSMPYKQIANMIKTYRKGEAIRFFEHDSMTPLEQQYAEKTADWGKLNMDRAQGVLVPKNQAEVFNDVVDYIRKNTSANEPIFVFSHNAQYHFLADRIGVTRFYSAIYASMDPEYQQEIISDLEKNKLRYIIYVADAYVFTDFNKIPNEVRLSEVFAYMQKNYSPETKFGNTFILRRKS